MKTGKKLLTGTLLAICTALLVLCSVLAIGWSKAAKTGDALPEVRNNGTAIQWKYSDEADWHDLVALTELRGAAGENGKNGTDGKDGINGVDGKDGADGKNGKDGIDGANGKDGINGTDGINAKSIEVQRAETHIQWRYEGDEWQNLVAIADITGPTGQKGADGANGKTPEFRVSENTLQWRYVGDKIWLNLYDLSVLKGLDGKDGTDGKDGADGKDGTNGQNGSDGVDGNTPFIGENGNWWIGETDTSVKAAGIDGTDGTDGVDGEKGDKGDKGDKGEKGDKGDKGDASQNGSCPGYFHASNGGTGASFNQPLQLFEDCNSGGLFVWDRANRTVTLKAGHTYSISFSGSVCISHDMGGWYSVVLKGRQGILNDTLIERYMNDADNSRVWMPFAFNRIYNAGSDIVLQYEFIQLTPGTQLNGAVYNITIIALD
ncbi:hypothetical protein [Ruminococcus sp.]|uniref:hypothetical protein n=1 Tax=Ruminococcus sp. TaxID=41978 RepID=UPI003AB83162